MVATRRKLRRDCFAPFSRPFLAPFLIGLLVGLLISGKNNMPWLSRNEKPMQAISGSIHRLESTPIRKTSHVDRQGNPIIKQQFLEPFAIPNVAGYSVATIRPGQDVEVHEHDSMHEFFYILEGNGIFQRGDQNIEVGPGTFLHFAPREKHGISVPQRASGDMKLLVSGITTLVG